MNELLNSMIDKLLNVTACVCFIALCFLTIGMTTLATIVLVLGICFSTSLEPLVALFVGFLKGLIVEKRG